MKQLVNMILKQTKTRRVRLTTWENEFQTKPNTYLIVEYKNNNKWVEYINKANPKFEINKENVNLLAESLSPIDLKEQGVK